MKQTLPILGLILVVFLAGCIGQGETSGSSTGVIIKDFSADFDYVAPTEPITLTLEVQNVGDSPAKNIKAELFALNPAEWTGDTSKTSFAIITISDLLDKAIPENKIPGGEGVAEWSLTAPNIGVPKQIYTAKARVLYEYTSSAAATFRFVTTDYLKSLPTEQQEREKAASGLSSQLSNNAPIKISFASTRDFVVVTTGSKFGFTIVLKNVGQGNPYKGDLVSGSNLYYLQFTKAPEITGNQIDVSCPALSSTTEIRLPRGESKTISCTATVNSLPINVLDGSVEVTLNYKYFVDSETSITVSQQY